MGKIHTHYDNLKVARLAPQEVIRAAYKALSQKYHPDKNPGDEKAARIMAILNSAYGTLADPQRRKEHDEWIAAEEWEIEWLESTQQEDNRNQARQEAGGWAKEVVQPPPAPRPVWRSWQWWGSLALCLVLGWLGAALMLDKAPLMPTVLVSAWSGPAHAADETQENRLERAFKADAVGDSWAVGKPYALEPGLAKAPEIGVLAVSQVLLQAAAPAGAACERDARLLVAPNGEAWPEQSGYVRGFPVGNKGADLELTLDNAGNASPMFVKLYDMERHANVRYLYIEAGGKLTVDRLAFGKYEVRYQKIDAGGEGCASAPRQTAVE